MSGRWRRILNRRMISRLAFALLLLCAFTLFFEARSQIAFAQLTGSIVINNGATYTTSSDVTLTLTANSPLLVQYARYNNDVLWRNANEGWEAFPETKTKAWTLSSGDGNKRVYYQFADYFGEISDVYSDTIVLDTVPPTGSIVINSGATFTTSTSVSLALTGVDLTSGVDQIRLSNTGSWGSNTEGWESFSSTKLWALSSGDGFRNVFCQLKDKAGLVSVLFTDSIGLDTSGPTGSIVINDGSAFTTSTSVTLALTANDPTSGVNQVRYSNDGDWDTEPWETFSLTKEWTLLPGDGVKTVYYQISDNAGLSSTYSDTIGLDTIAPTGTIVINSGDEFTTSASVSLTLTAADSTSGVFQVRYGNDGVWDTEDWESFSSAKSWTLSSGNGVKTVYYQVRDNAGLNSSTYSDTITLSTLVPTGSIVINDDDDFTTSGSVTLTLTYTDPFLPVSQVRYSNDGVWNSETWEAPSETKEWILTSGDGTKTVYYQTRNSLGSVSETFSDTILLDTAVPTGSIVINGGATYSASESVSLELTASDSASGVSQVRYSNDDVWDDESWEGFLAKKSWTLTSGNGEKTVYYQIKDKAGMLSATYHDTIILDYSSTPTPTPSSTVTPTPGPSDSHTSSPEPTRSNSGMIPPEAFYATAAIGIASIAAIVFVALKKPKSSKTADNFAGT